MWTWQCGGQWGDGATVSFNAVNSPAFSSSLAIPFFVPGHLIAALIYGSTRLPLPIYRYFMKITPLNRVNVCLFSRLPLLMWAPKLHGVPCINFCDIRQIKQRISPKAKEMRGESEWKAIKVFASKPFPACSFCQDVRCACVYNQHGWLTAINTIVLWLSSPATVTCSSVKMAVNWTETRCPVRC